MRTTKFPEFLLIMAIACASLAAQNIGVVRGRVVDETGRTVEGVSVECDPIDSRPSGSAVRTVQTDKAGNFLVDRLSFGSYKLFAMKESAEYPNMAFAFYSNNVFPTVTLTAAIPAAEIILKVGPQAGAVEGTVRDGFSGNRVNATFLLSRALNPDSWISMSQPSDFKILVPPGADVLIEVSAQGYKTWHYGGASDVLRRPPVRLDSGKNMKLEIQLEPEEEGKKGADPPSR
jgi:hypothetical protein